jgi:signal peptidase I
MSESIAVADRLPSTESHGLGDWMAWLLTTIARSYLSFLTTLGLIAVVPALASWNTYVVRTGSMAPNIRAGDVVVASPLSKSSEISLGRVMVFKDPASGTSGRVLVHRVVRDNGDGVYVTAGDANASFDTTPVPRAAFIGRGRLRVPFIGLPVVWLAHHRYVPLTLWIALTIIAMFVAIRPNRREGDDGDSTPTPATQGATPSDWKAPDPVSAVFFIPRRRHWCLRQSPRVIGFAAIAAVFAIVVTTAAAKFSADTRNAGNTWLMKTRYLVPYTTQVLADAPFIFYPLDETAGPTATDLSGNVRNGTFTAPILYHVAGALVTNPDYGITLNGGGARLISGGTAVSGPTTYSVELWFKTTTVTGGKLIGFESTQSSTSSKFDRHVFMRNDGRLSFGGWSGNTRIITTTAAYNNGAWHHLVVTARPTGGSPNYEQSTIYVDGVSVVSSTSSPVTSYTGWWRVGYGNLSSGSNYPASADFAGSIDNVAVYNTELTAARVAAHYAAR